MNERLRGVRLLAPPSPLKTSMNESHLYWRHHLVGDELKQNKLILSAVQAYFLTAAAVGRLLLCFLTRKLASNQTASFQDCRKVRVTGHTRERPFTLVPHPGRTDKRTQFSSVWPEIPLATNANKKMLPR